MNQSGIDQVLNERQRDEEIARLELQSRIHARADAVIVVLGTITMVIVMALIAAGRL